MNILDYKIRKIKADEISILDNFLYESIFQKENEEPAPREIINKPELQVYIKDFGKDTDFCLVAEYVNEIIGCVWTRILGEGNKGYGNVDDATPEFAISILKNYRGKGAGTSLMKEMLKLLRAENFEKASLSVQKENYASSMYTKIGFKVIEEKDEEYIMIYDLNNIS